METDKKEGDTGAMKNTFIILCLITSVLTIGCFTVSQYNKLEIKTRGEIRHKDTLFLKKGETRLEEILFKIGEPDYISENNKILVYIWEVFLDFITPFGKGRSLSCGILIIYLDEQNRYREWAHPRPSNAIDFELIEKILDGNKEYMKGRNTARSEN